MLKRILRSRQTPSDGDDNDDDSNNNNSSAIDQRTTEGPSSPSSPRRHSRNNSNNNSVRTRKQSFENLFSAFGRRSLEKRRERSTPQSPLRGVQSVAGDDDGDDYDISTNVTTDNDRTFHSVDDELIERAKRTLTRMIIIKYFEEGDQHAKIIPRTLAFYVKKRIKHLLDLVPSGNRERQRSLIKSHMKECRGLTGREIIEMIMEDDQWLQKHNPIHQVLLYNEQDNKFEQVVHDYVFLVCPIDRRRQSRRNIEAAGDGEYKEDGEPQQTLPANVRSNDNRLEHIFVLHVKRRWVVDSVLVQSTMAFSDCQAAEDWVASVYQSEQMMPEKDEDAAASVRYFDLQHNGYTRIYKNQRVPLERTGRTMVKIMLEKRQSQKLLEQLRNQYEELKRVRVGLAKSTTMVFEERIEDFYNHYDDDEDEIAELGSDDEEEEEEEELDSDFGAGYLLTSDQMEQQRNALLHSGYSSFVDFAKLPSSLMSTPEAFYRERRLVMQWKNVAMPKRHVDVTKTLKRLIRLGVPETLRRDYWLGVTAARETLKHTNNLYLTDFINTYSTYKAHMPQDEVTIESVQPRMFADFGGHLDTDSEHCYLTQEGITAAKRILCVLNDRNQDIDFCPMIPSIVSILLTHLDEAETYAALYHMIYVTRRVKWFFRLNKMDHALFVESFKDLLRKRLPDVSRHMENIDFDLNAMAHVWFEHMFISYLPFNFTIRLFDGFVNEGCKVLYRAGFAILKTLKEQILQCQSPNFLSKIIFDKSLEFDDEEQFFKTAYSLTLRRKYMKQLDEKNKGNIDMSKIDNRPTAFVKPKFCEGHSSEIIKNMSQWELLVTWLPMIQRVRKMQKIFTTSTHGYSLSSLYDKCSDSGACLIVIYAYPNLSEDDPDNIKYWKTQGESRLTVNDESGGSLDHHNREDAEMDVVDFIKAKKAEGVSLRKEILEEEERIRKLERSKLPIPDKKHVEKTSIFGVYCGETIEKTFRYKGTTDTFLYSLYPVEARYRWSRKNDFFVMGRQDNLVFGGGGDGPGLQFDDMLQMGSSYRSLTFENESLCGTAVSFTILKLEVWSFR